MQKLVSIIIPTYNEDKNISSSIKSLLKQTYQAKEILIVDDGSVDQTCNIVHQIIQLNNSKIKILTQPHSGPGEARNLGASKSKGEILLFLDADMTFDSGFIENLTKPIRKNKTIGTDSQDEFLANPVNFWARCWNMGRFAAAGNFTDEYLVSMVPNKENYGGIFRAIKTNEFKRVGGFSPGGDYSDDETLSKKLGFRAMIVDGAKFYHKNPDCLKEVWQRARWIGSGKSFNQTKDQQYLNLIKFFPLLSVIKGLIIGLRFSYLPFVFFKVIYDTAIWTDVMRKL